MRRQITECKQWRRGTGEWERYMKFKGCIPKRHAVVRTCTVRLWPHGQRARPAEYRPEDSLDQDVYGIEIEKCLERHVGENENGKQVKNGSVSCRMGRGGVRCASRE